jgi:membrane-bound serine protease (ClpP class)
MVGSAEAALGAKKRVGPQSHSKDMRGVVMKYSRFHHSKSNPSVTPTPRDYFRPFILAFVLAAIGFLLPQNAVSETPKNSQKSEKNVNASTSTKGAPAVATEGRVVMLPTEMLILPGTAEYIKGVVEAAASTNTRLIIIELSTPGGMLSSTEEIVKTLFRSTVPIVVYVSPAGGTATSAGLFVTMAAHIAAMAPGTTIGAAHPVGGQGENVEGDMRAKIENATMSMVRSIADERDRNVVWAEKAVKESASATATEALSLGVIDLIAESRSELLRLIAGKTIKTATGSVVLEDYSALPITVEQLSLRGRIVNVLANPAVIALLWVGASAGLGVEIYNPGLILPGVVGVLCLLAALTVSEIIPITMMGITFLVAGGLLLALELVLPSGALAIGGIVAIALGATTLIDVTRAPDLSMAYSVIIPILAVVSGFIFFIGYKVAATRRQKPSVGFSAMTGLVGTVLEVLESGLRIEVRGEKWIARSIESGEKFDRGDSVVVVSHQGNILLVKRRV